MRIIKADINEPILKLTLSTGINITNAVETKIKYVNPKGVHISVDAKITDIEKGDIYSEISGINKIKGIWIFQAFVKFNTEETLFGGIFNIKVV